MSNAPESSVPAPATPDARLTAAHVTVAAGLLIAILIIGWLDLQAFLQDGLGEGFTPYPSATPSAAAEQGDPLAPLDLRAFSTSATHRPLNHEPLNLAPLPGATLGHRFTTREGVWINEVSMWRIPATTTETVIGHYAKQASNAGFDRQNHRLSGENYHSWLDRQNPPRTLTVSVGELNGEVHVMIWLMYAIQPAPSIPGVPRADDAGRFPAPPVEAPRP